MNTTTKYSDADMEEWIAFGSKLVAEILAVEGYSARYSTAIYAVQKLSRRHVQIIANRKLAISSIW